MNVNVSVLLSNLAFIKITKSFVIFTTFSFHMWGFDDYKHCKRFQCCLKLVRSYYSYAAVFLVQYYLYLYALIALGGCHN